MKTPIEKFWMRVNRDGPLLSISLGPCWEWVSTLNDSGYGKFYLNGTTVRAHRFVFHTYVKPVLPSEFVLHHCDNRACVRPDHLYIGTKRDNLMDALTRGRHVVPTPPKGEQHSHAKLRNSDVLRIRELQNLGVSTGDIQNEFPVSQSTLSRIKTRKIWSHI